VRRSCAPWYDCAVPAQFLARISDNRSLGGGYVVLEMRGDKSLGDVVAGQFVMLRGEWGRELLNPRAFSVLSTEPDGRFTVLFTAYGRGTTRLVQAQAGDRITVTGPLGRGFRAPPPGVTQLLVAGGVGLPPLHLHARQVAAAGNAGALELFYGGRDRDDLVLTDDFAAWGVKMHLATEDGSVGARGFVTTPLEERLRAAKLAGERVEILSCGPTPMLAAVRKIGLAHDVTTWLCLEEEMACGFGVCLGCAVPTHGARPYQYCCSDGPVFEGSKVRWR
jgi:dihydroorotate dehydrogenase electron transfer subunit